MSPRAKLWLALWSVYLIWGSTYLGIALAGVVVARLVGAGVRAFLRWRGRRESYARVFGSLTARENILTAAEIRRSWSRDRDTDPGKEADRILDLVGIRSVADGRVDAMPTGLARLVELGLGHREIGAAVRAGAVLRLAESVVLLPDAPERAARLLAGLPQPFTLSAARQVLETSRRVAVPLLELLDRRGVTRRHPDGTRVLAGTAPTGPGQLP